VRIALQDAASVAGLMITTEAMVAETPKKKEAPAMSRGGMGGMDYCRPRGRHAASSGHCVCVGQSVAVNGLSNDPSGDIIGQQDDTQLTRGRLPTQLLKQRAQRVEFGAETGPIPGL
jgi:hypothetical protein